MLTWEQAVLQLKADPAQQDLVRSCYYDDPLIDAAERFRGSSEWRATRGLLAGRSGRALELGAGRGIATYALARDGWQVTAIEPDPSAEVGAGAIRHLSREAGLKIEVVVARGEALPFPDEHFQLVYGRAVLHHAADLAQLCQEVARVLKPGGALLATREHVLSKTTDLGRFLAVHPLHRHYGGEHAYLASVYRESMESAGLTVARELHAWESEVNLHPYSLTDIRAHVARRLRLPPRLVPSAAVRFAGRFLRTPGRLHTFLAIKA